MALPLKGAARVSVIVPVFNGAATIARAIDSAFDQRAAGTLEVVVVNDGSTDGTAAILEHYGRRIKALTQANRGLAAARNAGVSKAEGEYLAFLDADDEWLPDKSARLAAALDRDASAVLAYSDLIPVDNEGAVVAAPLIEPACAHAPSMNELLARWWPILPSTVMMRRTVFQACGGFGEGYRRAYEDADLWLRVRETGRFIFVREALVRYHVTMTGERMRKYQGDYALFARRISERYGGRARELLRSTRKAYASTLGYRGLVAMREGDRPGARRALIEALRYDPWHPRNTLRLARTLLPWPIARLLAGQTGRRRTSQQARAPRAAERSDR